MWKETTRGKRNNVGWSKAGLNYGTSYMNNEFTWYV